MEKKVQTKVCNNWNPFSLFQSEGSCLFPLNWGLAPDALSYWVEQNIKQLLVVGKSLPFISCV